MFNTPDAFSHPPCEPLDHEAAARGFDDLADAASRNEDAEKLRAELEADPAAEALFTSIFGTSPFLAQLSLRNPGFAHACLTGEPDELLAGLTGQVAQLAAGSASAEDLMTGLRIARAQNALLTAVADLSGCWSIAEVCQHLSDFADAAVRAAVDWMLLDAARQSKIELIDDTDPAKGCGYVVLAMGKHGAGELNYSSDIDLIVLYDAEMAPLAAGVEPATFFVRMTKRLVALLQEITADGFVFRVDLRLRPDPRATQVAIGFEAACIYYENMGQNWERAAMIKARPVAGDAALGEEFLDRLTSYVWRKYLDFAAIADVQSLKRQIHAVKGHGTIKVPGHNIKLGRGGIREIEFFVQTQQLIAGGRNPALRGRRTLEMLAALAEAKWISPDAANELHTAYNIMRTIEHRIQMIADEQSHELPSSPEALEAFARFCGFADAASFETALSKVFEAVQSHYAALFEDADQLASDGGSLVFTGGEDDPETVATLAGMGFRQPGEVSATIRGWHFGRYAATRSAQARERLTELMPQLLKALADAGDPDAAFVAFDRFMSHLPAGLQLFSMLRANPHLLDLLATILGAAPNLASQLSQRPRIFDAVLDPGFFDQLPDPDEIAEAIDTALGSGTEFEELLDGTRIIGAEHMFRVGVRLISETINAVDAGSIYASIADTLIDRLLLGVRAQVAERHGLVDGGQIAVIAMGKLGGREMTAASDLDLILIYDHAETAEQSDGARPLMLSQYFSRITQRLIAALSSPTAEGILYEVDMRLRPSGSTGPVATSLTSFRQYHEQSAWTWEKLALTRARVVAGDADLGARVDDAIADALCQPRDASATRSDIIEMRILMLAEHGNDNPWNLKHARGGLVDVEFIAQTLQLLHGPQNPQVFDQNTAGALTRLCDAGVLTQTQLTALLEANSLYHRLTQVLRLCVAGRFEPEGAPQGLRKLLINAAASPDLAAAEALLTEQRTAVAALFDDLIGPLNP
ncbi:MAG: bifunctional [glutamine synthetase] adenylyltransferase/[glutamine synthetase]-adenylyl-L-tyrosine phosphorylase [Hyphomicrobiales bacterium]|nr:bifunctional [glutamine synthetase] adenylyltransferase/[glutamine synthetase]-adenylyl-L-tyrosine phosphorylase [Hyphomicrobiales bacterium]